MKTISDVKVFSLKQNEDRLLILSENDHLLRRFGKLEVVNFSANTGSQFHLMKNADQIMALIEGNLTLELIDLRKISPSFGSKMLIKMSDSKARGILVPFGVASSISSEQNGKVIWLSTHANEDSSNDQILEQSEIDEMINNADG